MENKKTNSIKKKLGIVAVMLVLVLAIGATAGTTLARYISSATVESQTATVAKFGYTFTADTSKMFGTHYGDESDGFTVIDGKSFAKVDSDGTLVVNSEAKNLVAPGTIGHMTLTIQGSAQVTSELVLDFDDKSFSTVSLSGGDINGSYKPIKWAVGVDEDEISEESEDLTYSSVNGAKGIADLVAAAVNAVEELTEQGVVANVINKKVYIRIPANTDLTVGTITIAWKWDFHVNDKYDLYDTILGYKAVADESDFDGWADGWADLNESVSIADLDDYDATLDVNLKITATIMQVQSWTPVD